LALTKLPGISDGEFVELECAPMIGQVGLGEPGGVPPLVVDKLVGSQINLVSGETAPSEALH
jgi:hypothetical protein